MLQANTVPIIGGGPAGMSCALWLANYGLRPILIEAEPALGGMARRSPYPNDGLLGRPGETAHENAAAFARHIRELPIEVRLGASPLNLRRAGDGQFRLEIAAADPLVAQPIACTALVLATGTRFAGDEWLDGVANARRMMKQGRVHVGAPWAREAGAQLGRHVAVVGGGDNAFDVSRMLVEKGVKATIIMRSRSPRAQPLMVQRLRQFESAGAARIIAGRTVEALELAGEAALSLRLDDGSKLAADHVLLLLGYRPNSDARWLAKLTLERDERGYFIVDGNKETSCRSVFAIGDVADPMHPSIATAIAAGTMAAREIAKRIAPAMPSLKPPAAK
jgi:thioredoxin reductase (NADPH)